MTAWLNTLTTGQLFALVALGGVGGTVLAWTLAAALAWARDTLTRKARP